MAEVWVADGDGMPYPIHVDLAEVWEAAERWEREAVAGKTGLGLEDPVKRLEIISWLRVNGYKVEPA